MKKGIHPENYRPVVFKDMSNGDMFLSRSTCATKDTIEFEGETYPLVKLEISNTSHPFYTGKSKLVDTAGRVGAVTTASRNKISYFCSITKPGIFFFKKCPVSFLPFIYPLSFSRISTRRIFPLMVFGNSLTNSITRGYL